MDVTDEPTPVDPRDLNEHQLLEKIYESFLVLIKSTNQLRKDQRQVLSVKRFTAFIVAILLVLVVALQIQVQTRNKRLDEFNDRLGELKGSVSEIKAVSDEVRRGNPAQAKAVERLFGQVDLICAAVECESVPVPTTTTTEAP